jgi:MFS family permease
MFFSASGEARQRSGPAASAAAALPEPRRADRLGLFAIADFRRLWLIGLVVFAVRWLEMIVVGVFVYQHTGSAFDVALMTMLRMVPMALFGAVIGAYAERVERRTALIVVLLSMFATSFSLAALAYAGRLAVWHLAVASFVNGVAWAADNPVRRVMIGDSVGTDSMGRAMSVDVGANNASRMLGPTIGGVLLAATGIAGAFSVSVLCYVVALAAALRLSRRPVLAPSSSASVVARLIEGLMVVRRDRRLIGILTITVIYNVFGWPFTSMIPVIGQDSLGLGPSGIGILASMDGIGSFCGAVLIAVLARPRHYGWCFAGGVISYQALVIVFALMPHALPAGAALLFTGLSSAGFSIMQATLVYLSAPLEMRSRMYGVLSVCIGVGPVGFLHLGLLAELIGAPSATIVSALEGLVAMAVTWRWWRILLWPAV